MIVVENSVHMVSRTFDHDGDGWTPEQTPWEVARAGVETLVDHCDLEGPGDCYMQLGSARLSHEAAKSPPAEAACWEPGQVDVPIGDSTGAAILASLPSADSTPEELRGAVPLASGVELGVSQMLDDTNQPNLIALFASTPANCADGAQDSHTRFETLDGSALAAVEQAYFEHQIGTVVFGVDVRPGESPNLDDGAPDGVDAHEYFNALALAGGGPRPGAFEERRYWDGSDPQEIEAGIEELVNVGVQSCVFDLTVPPNDPPAKGQELLVTVDGAAFPQVFDCSTEDGWVWVEDSLVLELCGVACDEFKWSKDEAPGPQGIVEIDYLCP
jgi:hypothetical protein